MTCKRFEINQAPYWLRGQQVPTVFGTRDEVVAMTGDPAEVLLDRLFGPRPVELLLVWDGEVAVSPLEQTVDVCVSPLTVDASVAVSPLEIDIDLEVSEC